MKAYEIYLEQAEKRQFLLENWSGAAKLHQRATCLQCGSSFLRQDFKATLERDGAKFIRCPTWPGCNGTINDWIEPPTADIRFSASFSLDK